MSRWKSPSSRPSPYISQHGYHKLENELKSLWIRRREVTIALGAAAAEGDRSENAEYIYRKKELREIDRRIRYLQIRLPELNIVTSIQDHTRIYFGARVLLKNPDGSETPVRIVGADELDAESGHISVDSPLARALLGKQTTDQIEYRIMTRTISCTVIAIEYD